MIKQSEKLNSQTETRAADLPELRGAALPARKTH